ncbi:alpha-1,2-fucosyltransferase [Cyclobacterium sp.]|uniref:alpha-1,2-fucosyltransferase n=1 Tax=Cyclobacterium sp. TaxID=1966343 RepID=UPI00199F79CD|nr:alpha-1,2-fucosyltransferase [Cyclobacterium sp.]MBD3627858.1 alpha-1,2-fucosyltransferase [Cyclobacterium sp.]
MIIIKFLGGLGNQLFQYAFGLKLAEERKSRLASDIHWYNISKDRQFVLNKFQIKILHLPRKGINFFASDYALRLDKWLGPLGYHHYFEETEGQVVPIPNQNNLYLRGYWNAHIYFDSVVGIMREHIQLKSTFQSEAYRSVLRIINNCESVAVHIRRGDYAKNSDYLNYFGLTTIEYFQNAIEFIEQTISFPQFFIFTDDVEWVNSHLSLPESSTLVSDEVNGVDFLEFDLMRKCRHQIISNSTFSWWAARLNSHSGKIIIQPKKWYEDPTAQKRYEKHLCFYMKGAIRL